jgi:hypothetical protein
VVIALASRSKKAQTGYAIDKSASGPLARRGSSPFPGASNIKLGPSPAGILFWSTEKTRGAV